MAPKPRFRQQFPKPAFCGALEEASASSELGCAGLGLIRRYALHVRDSGAADPSRFAKTAAPLERSKRNAKREERREHFEERRQKREERYKKRNRREKRDRREKQREQRGSGKVEKTV